MFWRLQALLVKRETTYGADPVPTGAANAIMASNVRISPMKGTIVAREFDRPQFAAQAMLLVGLYQTITFEVEAKAANVPGNTPPHGPLLKACKMADTVVAATSVTYNPHSGVQDSVSIYFYVDGVLFRLAGVRGTFKFKLNALQIPVYEFTMTGLFTQPSTAALPVLGGTTFATDIQKSAMAASTATTPTFTLGGTALPLRSLSFDAGCQVVTRFLVGSDTILIKNASESIDLQIDAVALATFNPFSVAAAMTTQALSLVHGAAAGSRIALNIPALQLNPVGDPADVDEMVEWKLSGIPQAASVTGNDQYSIVYS